MCTVARLQTRADASNRSGDAATTASPAKPSSNARTLDSRSTKAAREGRGSGTHSPTTTTKPRMRCPTGDPRASPASRRPQSLRGPPTPPAADKSSRGTLASTAKARPTDSPTRLVRAAPPSKTVRRRAAQRRLRHGRARDVQRAVRHARALAGNGRTLMATTRWTRWRRRAMPCLARIAGMAGETRRRLAATPRTRRRMTR